jgi:PEP-CTERM motif
MSKLAFLMIGAGVSLVPARAGNLILNPGFEAGDFTSWTVAFAADGSDMFVSGQRANTGDKSTAFAGTTPGSFDSIEQSFIDTNGQAYTFSFFLNANLPPLGGDGPAISLESFTSATIFDPVGNFQAFWNGSMVFDSEGSLTGGFDFTQFSFQVTGTGNDAIAFRGYNVPDRYFLDDVSVVSTTATPEPSTWVLMAAGLAALAAFRLKLSEERSGNRKCTPSFFGWSQPD